MDMMSYLLGQQAGGSSKGLKVEVVEELPETGEANILYLVPKEDTGDNDIFDEWLYIEDEWEHIGSTDIDLSNYYTKDEVYNKTQVDAKIPLPITVLEVNYGSQLDFPYLDGQASQKIRNTGVYLIKNTNTFGYAGYPGIMYAFKTPYNSIVIRYEDLVATGAGKRIAFRTQSTSGSASGVNAFAKNNFVFNQGYDLSDYANIPAFSSMSDHQFFTFCHYRMYLGSKAKQDLQTTNKTSIVDAINEVNSKIGDINTVLATLTTPMNGGN